MSVLCTGVIKLRVAGFKRWAAWSPWLLLLSLLLMILSEHDCRRHAGDDVVLDALAEVIDEV